MLKGNNLLALYSLLPRYEGKIKLIYIDPPYNTGSDGFGYNDKFNHSTWLVFMKNRLEIARRLLREDGVIWINLDDIEARYAKVLGDEVFGRENFIANVIWKKKYSPQNDAQYFSAMHDHLLVFGKDKEKVELNLLPRTEEAKSRYKNPDDDSRGPWQSGDLLRKDVQKTGLYTIINPRGRKIDPPKGTSWRVPEYRFYELQEDNRIWFGEDGSNVPRIKRFLSEVKDGTPPQTVWDYSEVGHTQDARKHIIQLFQDSDSDFATPKPEGLLARIVRISSDENDIVLDYHLGSGTTTAVAHKMNRRWIGVEQMDYIEDVTKMRLRKVIGQSGKDDSLLQEKVYTEYDEGGISKAVNWRGGGSFVYPELAENTLPWLAWVSQAKKKTRCGVSLRSYGTVPGFRTGWTCTNTKKVKKNS